MSDKPVSRTTMEEAFRVARELYLRRNSGVILEFVDTNGTRLVGMGSSADEIAAKTDGMEALGIVPEHIVVRFVESDGNGRPKV